MAMMKTSLRLLLLTLVMSPLGALAHGGSIYEIGGVEYEFIVGSLGEPVIVDDKTGVEIQIVRAGKMLVGAQENLKVELQAGNASRTLDLSPVYGADGHYKANFIATVPTTLTYRVFGELEGVPVNLSFTCNPAGHPQAEEVTERVTISEGVVQTKKSGSFGCPREKSELGFPEATPSSLQLADEIASLKGEIAAAREDAQNARTTGVVVAGGGFILALLVILFLHRKKAQKSFS